MNLNYVCKVDGCPRMFSKTNTWYKHVIQYHHEEYFKKNASSEVKYGAEPDDDDDDNQMELSVGGAWPEGSDGEMDFSGGGAWPEGSDDGNYLPTTILSEKVIAGKLLKIREKHLVSHAVINDIMELVESICNDMSTKAISSIHQSGDECGMDTSSLFFQELPQIFERLNSPLASIGTAYKQQSFIAKNLPYVVSIIISLSCQFYMYSS